jgi:hypothetical protein
MCRFGGKHSVINSSYHACISPIPNPLPYNTTYLSWFATSYNGPSFTLLMWSYHWWSRYPFALMPLQEWAYNNPQYTLGYYHNYCFGKWSTCSEGGFPPFPSPHPMTIGYPYHQRWFLDLDGRHHCWTNLHRYGSTSINNDNTCSDDGCSGEYMIIYWTSTKQWFHSLCYWDIWVFAFLFDSFFTVCAHTVIMHHHWSSLINHWCLFLTINNACP